MVTTCKKKAVGSSNKHVLILVFPHFHPSTDSAHIFLGVLKHDSHQHSLI